MPAISNLVVTNQTTRQTGIRQRSLRHNCRMGRATELVFVLMTGVTVTLGGSASAQQNLTYDTDPAAGTQGTAAGNWNNTETNWSNISNPQPGESDRQFANNDNVTFGPTAAAGTITINGGNVSPGSMTFSGTGYVIAGSAGNGIVYTASRAI
ncbi:MAG: hypothetical protein ACRC6I_01665, partial [Paracoccaceae bacterium]